MLIEKSPRLHDDGYLEWLRRQPCVCGCRQGPPCDAAHIRAASPEHNKPLTGGARKPDDRWALPLKHDHHMDQSVSDELGWWRRRGIDPFALALRFYATFGGDGGQPRKRKARVITRKPKAKRQKIPSRPFPTTQRKLWSKRK
jgi:hypothetical protein